MREAKIRLSQKEMELITNADWILTKNAILQKVNKLLGSLQEKQSLYLSSSDILLPEPVLRLTPKISKGENYQGLPYQVLDYPRLFDKENLPDRQASICAIRTMFWWGNFLSITLHLSGIYKKNSEEKIFSLFEELKGNGFYCCVNEDQWEHHFEETNYKQFSVINITDFKKLVNKSPFIKLAAKIPLEQWDDAEEFLLAYFKKMIGILVD